MFDDKALDAILRTTRAQNTRLLEPVTGDDLRRIYELMKRSPTSAHSSPARFSLRTSRAANERLPIE